MNRLNKRMWEVRSEKYWVRSGEYGRYCGDDGKRFGEMTSFISNEGLKKDENVMIKGIYLESPNKKFVEKYTFFHPKT